MATVKQLVGLANQYNEIVEGVGSGSLDADSVKLALQNIIEGKMSTVNDWNSPTWWRTPEQQLDRARQLWPGAVLPEPPAEFIPQAKSEVLLLHVPDSFDSLWNLVDAPKGYTKSRRWNVRSGKGNLRLAPNVVDFTEPVWLAFDPEHGKGMRPSFFWGKANIAASEVFSALIQFPEWPLDWLKGASTPSLAGYQLNSEGVWSCVPYVNWWDDPCYLGLDVYSAGARLDSCSVPSVRVL